MTASIDTSFEDPEVWRRMEPLIRQNQQDIAFKMNSGKCTTWAAYCAAVGRWRTLQWVLDVAQDVNSPPPMPPDQDTDTDA